MLKRFLVFILILSVPMTAWAIKYKGDLESNESITFPEQSSKPASPAAAKYKLYFKDDGVAYFLDSSGNENPVAGASFKNKLINGNFDLWQRGSSFSPIDANRYSADRWDSWHNGTTETVNITREAFALGQTDVPGNPEYFMRMDIATLGDLGIWFADQKIEGVDTLAGETITISLYLKVDATTGSLALPMQLVQVFGTGGSPSPNVPLSTTFAVTSSWQKFTWTTTLGSISGKTLGTNGNDYLQLVVLLKSGAAGMQAAGHLDIARVQIEKGSVATDFEQRPFALELTLAQRYFWKTFDPDVAPAQNTANYKGAIHYTVRQTGVNFDNSQVTFPVTMRAAPTITFYNPGAANTKWRNLNAGADSGTPALASNTSARTFSPANTQVAGDNAGNNVYVHATADAEL